jgi:hypothetical protein
MRAFLKGKPAIDTKATLHIPGDNVVIPPGLSFIQPCLLCQLVHARRLLHYSTHSLNRALAIECQISKKTPDVFVIY